VNRFVARLLRPLLPQKQPEQPRRPLDGPAAERLEAAKQHLKETIPPKPGED
jgi:hypothetical protein